MQHEEGAGQHHDVTDAEDVRRGPAGRDREHVPEEGEVGSLDEVRVGELAGRDVDASIGIACFPGHGVDVELLLQRADAAMYKAKRAQTRYELYEPEMDQ